jgi:minor extracellular serine protease Vpr
MKKSIVFIISIILCISAFPQSLQHSSSLEMFRKELKNQWEKNGSICEDFREKYPVTKQQGVDYVSTLAIINEAFCPETIAKSGIRTGSIAGRYATLRIPVSWFEDGLFIQGVEYLEVAGTIAPSLDRAIKDSRVDSVHMGWNLPIPISGKNVIIGITDWGFDYSHPMFYDTSLTNTRILAAWDQFRQEGPAPSGFDYGTVFTGPIQLQNAQCDTFNIYEYATHGSHVAGIAGGSGAGTIYRGVAFDSEFLFTTFLIDAAAVIDAFGWMKSFAENQGKRLVINMSWGLYYMGHLDGTSILSQVIDQMSNEGVVFVSSAGNNGNDNFHIRKNFSSPTDTLKTLIKFDSYSYYPKMWGQSISMWGSPGDTFSISLKILDPQNNQIAETPFYSTATPASYQEDQIIIGNDTIFFNLAAEASNPFNLRPHFRLRVRNTHTSSYKVALYSTSTNADVHYWNVIELVNGVGNWGSEFQAPLPGWTAGDNLYGIGEPACTESVITVAAHNSQLILGNNTVVNGNIAGFSSSGPLMTEEMKPDISAPGQNVCSSISSFTSMSISPMNIVQTINFNGRNYIFVKFSGTSMSSPHVAGVVALMLEANPLLTPMQIKEILKETAREDDKTGIIPPEGSTKWGWGKLHALHAVYQAMGILAIQENTGAVFMTIFPNPAQNKICLRSSGFEPSTVYVTDIKGVLAGVSHFMNGEEACINIEEYPGGTYLVFATNGQQWQSAKFIKL